LGWWHISLLKLPSSALPLRVSMMLDPGTIGQQQHATVTRLAAPQRVKHRAIQHDALRRDGGDRGAALGQVGVAGERGLGS
jgi:hypothetical protein